MKYTKNSLEISSRNSVQTALDDFETWSDLGVRYSCDVCMASCRMVGRTKLERCPKTLFLSIPRFSENWNSSTLVDSNVLFCTESFLLDAVVNHEGSTMVSGHYTASVRSGNDQWTVFDDHKVGGHTFKTEIQFSSISEGLTDAMALTTGCGR